ncbi:MAG: coproporphyrinogen dehydrogenase HemZ [Clostridia bacterium]|nr:coproporphyrinogen dehydrogenase HemZ [Clostridia bacterium]
MRVFVNHSFEYEVEHLIKTFEHDVEFVADAQEADLVNVIDYHDHSAYLKVVLDGEVEKNIQLGEDSYENKRLIKRNNTLLIYDVLTKHFHKTNPWGTLVGVRPGKIVQHMLDLNMAENDIDQVLYDKYRIETNKRKLLMDVAKHERPYLQDIYDKPLSLYICIPFCPTRCLYCSFPSNDLKQKGRLLEDYLQALHHEIDAMYDLIQKNKRLVDCIYIGGGTPSVLSSQQFMILFQKLDDYFHLKTLKEFTVEAGRPDTITKEKLDVFKVFHVSRICLNPQSMHDKTLNLIGRSHSAEAILDAYELIKSYDFDSINMDLILGLPDEDIEDVKETLDAVIQLNPENITIHTLAVKTSSRLKEKLEAYHMTQSEMVESMINIAQEKMMDNGYHPYYMYRQKNMVGNFENVGYAKLGKDSLYNIRIIEEMHDILALGAGAVSKKVNPLMNRFDRIANIKGLETYLERIEDVIEKKKVFFEPFEE